MPGKRLSKLPLEGVLLAVCWFSRVLMLGLSSYCRPSVHGVGAEFLIDLDLLGTGPNG